MPTERQPQQMAYELLVPGSPFQIRKDIMVPATDYDFRTHQPDKFYRLVVNVKTGCGRLVLQSEIDRAREIYREQHGRAGT